MERRGIVLGKNRTRTSFVRSCCIPVIEAMEQRMLLSVGLEMDPNVHTSPYAPIAVQQSTAVGGALFPRDAYPASFSLRPSYVTGVKNQGAYGTCWAFATYGSLESSILKAGGPATDLSENNLKNYHGFDWGPGDGGNTYISEAYLSRGSGPVSEADDPYHDYDDRITPAPTYPRQYWVKEMLRFNSSDEIKNALMTLGALYTSMNWVDNSYRASDYSYYYTGTGTNHGVTIVGWDDAKVTAAATPGAWLIRNSWGSGWGDGGYFWLSYADSVGGKTAESFGSAVAPSTYDRIYYWDTFGNVSNLNTPWAMNRFVAQGSEQLQSIGFFTQADNATYNIRVYDNYSGGALSGLLRSTTGTAATAGWHTVSLPSSVSLDAGNDFYVVVQLTNAGSYPHAFDYAAEGYSSASTAAPNQSWYSFNGTSWTDLTTFSSTANFSLKAYTTNAAPSGRDLYGTGLQVTSESLYGGEGSVSFSIRNGGDTDAGAFSVRFYLSDDAIIDPSTDILVTLRATDPHFDPSDPSAYRIASLAASTTFQGNVSLAVPSTDPFGTDNSYYIGMVVDADGEIAEINESNNRNVGEGIDRAATNYNAIIYSANMNTNPGWTLQGQWAWGQPLGGGGAYGNPDPTAGYTQANVIGYNLNGDYANSIGSTYWATTSAINCSGFANTQLSFYRWLGVEEPAYDHAYIQVSNDGSTWTTLWQNTGGVTDSAWTKLTYDISAVADNQSTVYVRWGMGTTDGSLTFCGWNIDDVQVIGTPFEPPKSGTPDTPDLASDTGASAVDNLTRLDNGAASERLQFAVGGTVPGATVEIYAGDVVIGSAVATASTTTVMTDGVTHLADGVYTIRACQTQPGLACSDLSGGISIEIETAPLGQPGLAINDGLAQRSTVRSLTLTFAEATNLLAGATTLKYWDGSTVPGTTMTIANPSADQKTFILTFSGSAITGGSLADGTYDLAIASAGAQDLAGNGMAAGFTRRFHRLFGDADGNKVVNALDYTALRNTFDKHSNDAGFNGAFDYDNNNVINATDLAQFRKRFGVRYVY